MSSLFASSSEKFSKLVSRQEEKKEPSLYDDISDSCSLSKKTRVYGFCICCAIGAVLSFLATLTIGNITRFAILYSLGNLTALCSTAFLIGPCRQLKNMFAKKRIIATCVYLTSLLAVLGVAIFLGKKYVLAVLVLMVIEFLALIWYTASYIPYARAAIKRCLKNVTNCDG